MIRATLLCLLLAPSVAMADLWLTTGFWSRHTSSDREFRENNTGIGIKYNDWSAGVYKSSLDRDAWYAVYDWKPLAAGPFSAGISAGLSNGPEYADGKPSLIVMPVVSVAAGPLGADVVFVPPIRNYAGLVAVRFRVRILE